MAPAIDSFSFSSSSSSSLSERGSNLGFGGASEVVLLMMGVSIDSDSARDGVAADDDGDDGDDDDGDDLGNDDCEGAAVAAVITLVLGGMNVTSTLCGEILSEWGFAGKTSESNRRLSGKSSILRWIKLWFCMRMRFESWVSSTELSTMNSSSSSLVATSSRLNFLE